MIPPLQPDPIPLHADERGGLRVGASRVLLDTVIDEYEENGADPEGIVHAYPTLQLADVYAVIAYYLRHRGEVDEYLRRREAEATQLRREIEAQQPDRAGLRAKLLARRAEQEQGHAPLAADENVHGAIIRGLRRLPDIDLVRVEEAGMAGSTDPEVLEWAAAEGRVLITQDEKTMVGFAWDRVRAGQPMPGVTVRGRRVTIHQAIELELVATLGTPEDFRDQVRFLPL